MRLGGARAPDPPPPRYKTPGEDLFDAFCESFDSSDMLTLLALRAMLEEKPRPSFLAAPAGVRKFFEEIAETFGISDP